MDATAIGARLASAAVAPLVKRLFVPDGPGAGLVRKPVRISGLVAFRGEKRTLGDREVRKLVEQLVAAAVRGCAPGERPVSPDEELATADALVRTLLVLGEIGMDDVQAVRLGHRAFAQVLRERAPEAARGLSADAEHLYVALLDTACLHILHFFTQRSTFAARSLVEHSRQLDTVVQRLDLLASRVRDQSLEDARFERRYADFVARKYGTLTIYGLDLRHCREWPLDTAYLSLEAVSEHHAEEEPESTGIKLAPHTAAQPADHALAGHERILLRGVAGSGKTTLVQWLAVVTARQDVASLPEGMTHLLGRVPFVLPLRSLTRGGADLPPPERFLEAAGCPLVGSQPAGWADRVLTSGRGLLLVDGLDEVPEQERERTRRWLRDLLLAYPGNLWLITCRPSAVREGWLSGEGFTDLALSPMGRAQVAAFVQRWHRAAEAESALEESLTAALQRNQDLARLATNPLMCGLICALHRERRGFLPRGRKALYDAALSMLLERRDRERDMYRPGDIELDAESQTELLQKLAYWLIRNGRSEMELADAVDLLDRMLPSMPHVADQGSAEDIFRHLLLRSGLLREPAPQAVDFVHRTFQDYLGAREAVAERDFDVLADHAHLDQWEDVVQMAVAHARPDERGRILRKLIARGDAQEEPRARLHLLATACLGHATQLDPAVREEVEQRAAQLIPPRSFEEARTLAQVGPVVLDLLPGPEDLTGEEAVAVAHTAGQIGGESALRTMVGLRDVDDVGVRFQLGDYWDRFDTDIYAEHIISRLAPTGARIAVRSHRELELLQHLGGAGRVSLYGDFSPDDIVTRLSPELEDLALVGNPTVPTLDFLTAFPRLRSLQLSNCPEIRDLSPLSLLPLTDLYLWELPGLSGMRGADTLQGLTRLIVGTGVPCDDLSRLPSEAPLNSLLVPPTLGSLDGIEAWRQLDWVSLYHYHPTMAVEDWRSLAVLSHLVQLAVRPGQLTGPVGSLSEMPQVTRLYLYGPEEAGDLALLQHLFPRLEQCMIFNVRSVDLAMLAGLPRLQHVQVRGLDSVANREALPEHVAFVRLPPERPGAPSPP
ncbi:NACHT domain-containing NTPase [Streptomyces sp. JJ38]|uniref:NACHT domain-containing protein n=1 Tax=Streptomyces sp. JJ38 TaxID=2738128 RepID=UPI001C569475|nr:NACHT domain-containing protein [Streptomyces sp. JJ38]MBW1595869.1 NACHT domain-containing protein [Streptomyces sp. JJ38]